MSHFGRTEFKRFGFDIKAMIAFHVKFPRKKSVNQNCILNGNAHNGPPYVALFKNFHSMFKNFLSTLNI